ncbi:hypothetical protein [Streptomyces uncialis]|uniref:hypothetical protein n=1 Tax=Streptomyces uncialis TaxID=1048205 RepID=UPI00386CAA4F|nr:hypothetical protein OG924_19930 [Streptomyces uncialis]
MTVLAGTIMAGCGPGERPAEHSGSKAARTFDDVDRSQWPDATPRRGLAKGLKLPLERYMQSYEQRVAIDQAVRDQQTACMAGFGFEFRPPPAGTTPPPNPNDANMERRYGITDRVVAERHGYGLAKEEPPAGSSSPKLGEAATMVLSGAVDKGDTKSSAPISYKGKEIPQGGCSGWAPRKVGAAGLDFSLVSRLNYESLTRSQETPKVRAALKSWSRCMKEKGYEVAIPFDAIHLTTGKGNGSEKAVAIALADIDCKKSTDLVSIWYRVDSGIQREQIKQHRTGLEASSKQNETAVRTAERLLRG